MRGFRQVPGASGGAHLGRSTLAPSIDIRAAARQGRAACQARVAGHSSVVARGIFSPSYPGHPRGPC